MAGCSLPSHLTCTCRGYTNTSAVKSAISFIDGDKGILRYRGYPIEQLAERSNFTEVCLKTVGDNAPQGSARALAYRELQRSNETACWNEALLRHSTAPGAADRTPAALLHATYCSWPFSLYLSHIFMQVIHLLAHGGLLR